MDREGQKNTSYLLSSPFSFLFALAELPGLDCKNDNWYSNALKIRCVAGLLRAWLAHEFVGSRSIVNDGCFDGHKGNKRRRCNNAWLGNQSLDIPQRPT